MNLIIQPILPINFATLPKGIKHMQKACTHKLNFFAHLSLLASCPTVSIITMRNHHHHDKFPDFFSFPHFLYQLSYSFSFVAILQTALHVRNDIVAEKLNAWLHSLTVHIQFRGYIGIL